MVGGSGCPGCGLATAPALRARLGNPRRSIMAGGRIAATRSPANTNFTGPQFASITPICRLDHYLWSFFQRIAENGDEAEVKKFQDALAYPPRMMNADRSAAYVDLS